MTKHLLTTLWASKKNIPTHPTWLSVNSFFFFFLPLLTKLKGSQGDLFGGPWRHQDFHDKWVVQDPERIIPEMNEGVLEKAEKVHWTLGAFGENCIWTKSFDKNPGAFPSHLVSTFLFFAPQILRWENFLPTISRHIPGSRFPLVISWVSARLCCSMPPVCTTRTSAAAHSTRSLWTVVHTTRQAPTPTTASPVIR